MELRRGSYETVGSYNNHKSFLSTAVPATVLSSLFDLILSGALGTYIMEVQKQVRTRKWLLKVPQRSQSSDMNPASQTHMVSDSSPYTLPKMDWLNYKAIRHQCFNSLA